MAALDFVAVPIETTHVTFNDLSLGRSPQEVVCRLLRSWDSRNINRNNEFMGITLLFLDEKNSVIHGFIPATLANQFRHVLREGLIYRLGTFDVGRCTKMYKITESPFVLRFLDGTTLTPVEPSFSIEPLKFMLRNLDHLQALANTNLELPDVVGQIRYLQGSNLNDPTSMQRLVVRFRVAKDVTVCLSLWDDVAATFRAHMNSDNHLQNVMIVTTANPKLFGGNLFLNSTPATRFFFDATIEGIRKFKDSMGIHGDTTSFTRADTTESLGKMETLSISELQKYISQPNEQIQDADFLCKATIDRVLRRNGWSYISCGACSRKLDRTGTALRCNKCVSSRITGIVRYRVELSVKDTDASATFVVFDTEMTKQTSKTAATLMVETTEDGNGELPQCLQAFEGKTFLFKIRVSPFNFTTNHRSFTVSTMTEHNPDAEQAEEKGLEREMAIQKPAEDLEHVAPNNSPHIGVQTSTSDASCEGSSSAGVNGPEGNNIIRSSSKKRERE